MPRELYNEGRVVGYSAYELYVKQHQAENPDIEPATEREWLSSTLAFGSSMLLKITPSEELVRDFQFPTNTRLCAANTIIASHFIGNGNFGSGIWANRVTNYGDLVLNNSSQSPSGTIGPSGTVPYNTELSDESGLKLSLMQYLKIIDGVIIQPGTWSNSPNVPPQKDMSPDMSSYPRLRLSFQSPITSDVYVLLTGFTNRVIVQGMTGIDSSTNTQHPEDGDFLGPSTFPWSNKVIFTTPLSLTYYLKDSLVPLEGNDEQSDSSTLPYDNVLIHKDDDSEYVKIEVQKQINSGGDNVVVEPDNNEHQSETTISVKNHIYPSESAAKFMTITQTDDEGEPGLSNTEIDIHSNKLLDAGLTYGSGLIITDTDDEKKLIRTDLKSGNGIKLEPASSDTPGTQTISTNIAAGAGIQITTNSSTGELTIINSVISGRYTRLTLNEDYRIHWYNNFFAGSDADGYRSSVPSDRGTVWVGVQLTSDSSGNVSGASIQFNTNQGLGMGVKFAGNLANTDNFMFRHTRTYVECPESRIYRIEFINDYAYLNDYSFVSTSGTTTGIWNLDDSTDGNKFGASWYANCAIQSASLSSQTGFMVSAVQYSDGYNQQLTHYGKPIYVADHLNITVTGTLQK